MPENKLNHTPGDNSNVQAPVGGINPSAPTAGTEAWGQTSDERRVLGDHSPEDTRAGQMKGNPGDHMTAASHSVRSIEQARTRRRAAIKVKMI